MPAEDSHDLEKIFINNKKSDAKLTISVPILSKISNFDDLDPLRNQKNININYVRPGDNIPQKTDIILLLGSKSTISDLRELRENNWDREIRMHHDNNGVVIGLCGGYQMLGKFINDNEKIESSVRATRGLELLDVETEMINSKNRNKNQWKTYRIEQEKWLVMKFILVEPMEKTVKDPCF